MNNGLSAPEPSRPGLEHGKFREERSEGIFHEKGSDGMFAEVWSEPSRRGLSWEQGLEEGLRVVGLEVLVVGVRVRGDASSTEGSGSGKGSDDSGCAGGCDGDEGWDNWPHEGSTDD